MSSLSARRQLIGLDDFLAYALSFSDADITGCLRAAMMPHIFSRCLLATALRYTVIYAPKLLAGAIDILTTCAVSGPLYFSPFLGHDETILGDE